MFELLTSLNLFLSAIVLFILGALGSLVLSKKETAANLWGNTFAVLGSAAGLASSILILIFGKDFSFNLNTSLPALSISFSADKLSAFFIMVISLISLVASIYAFGYVKHYYKKYSIGTLGFFYNFFLAGMLMVAVASNALFFLLVWEIMSLSSYFLVIFENKEKENIKAGALYFVMTHIGTAFIMFAFLLLYSYTGSLDFGVIKGNMGAVPELIKNIVFILALIGFGTKAGIIPLHIWLPSAHPAAPSHVSALMSGVMIKTGIYMFVRIFMDIMPNAPLWWGAVILILGAISSLLGVLYALTEHDVKRLLAYHSIENIGIILLGLGSSLIFWALDMKSFAIVALTAGLFHTLNHALFKSLLFMGAGAVISKTHTRNMEEYGGLIKTMPQTAFFFLVGSMAISALPPFNGFFSEWLTFQSLFSGITLAGGLSYWTFIVGAAALAFTGGLAAMCFVKAFGISFLARPRSEEAKHAKEVGLTLRIAMAILAALTLVVGFFSANVTNLILGVVKNLGIFNITTPAIFTTNLSVGLENGFSLISMPFITSVLFIVLLVVFAVVAFITKKRKVVIGETWDCGTTLNSRMEITSTGFTRSIVAIFKGVLKPTKQVSVEYRDDSIRYFQKSNVVELGIKDIYRDHIYKPVQISAVKISEYVKKIQSGNVNMYILYILAILIALLLIVAI